MSNRTRYAPKANTYRRPRGALRTNRPRYQRQRPVSLLAAKLALQAVTPKKGVDAAIDDAAVVATTGTNDGITVLNLIQIGSASYNRIGRTTHLKSVRLSGTVLFTDLLPSAIQTNVFRMLLVWDQQPGDAIPTFDTIFGITSQTGTETSSVLAPPRYDNMARFRVLMDRRFDLNLDSAPTTSVEKVISFDEYVKLRGLESNYKATSDPATIANISTGALYLIYRKTRDSNTVAVQAGAIMRLRYTD